MYVATFALHISKLIALKYSGTSLNKPSKLRTS